MIDRLITALNLEADLSAEEIADTIWLALQIQPDLRAIAVEVEDETMGVNLQNRDRASLERENLPEIPTRKGELQEEKPAPKEAGIYPQIQQKTASSLDFPVKIPDAPSLRSPLHLVRALKPLMRRIPSGRNMVLDEAETTQRIAEEGIWMPVLKPTLEPWLDLELVVDESLSMHLWRRAIKEWIRLLKNYGIFRDVRVWGLLEEEGRVGIRRGIGGMAKNQRLRSPAELIDSMGRRLVLVVSDCVSSLWREGRMVGILALWGNRQPMAIAQMLPRWLWGRTGLGRGSKVQLRGLTPGAANPQLQAEMLSLWDEEEGINVPVLTLEVDSAAIWAQMVAGKGVWCTGVMFAREGWREKSEVKGRDRLTAEERVQGFRVTASPVARAIDADTNPDFVRYDFIEGVRELLIDSVPSSYVLDVVDKVSQFIARRLGLSLESFAAILKNPQESSDSNVVDEVRPFAMVTAQVLRCLGGEYMKVAEELEKASETQIVEFESESENRRKISRQNTESIEELKIAIENRPVDFTRRSKTRQKTGMKRFVFLKIGSGDFDRGFDVTLKIASPDRASFMDIEIDCELPPNSQIPIAYQNWFDIYKLLPTIVRARPRIGRIFSPENTLEECYNLAKQLKKEFKNWLSSSTNLKFQRLREKLCDRLEPKDEIFVFIQTQNEILQKLPWQEWDLFRDRFPKAEIALSPLEIENNSQENPRTGQNKVKILSILGDKVGINVEKDKKIITSLQQAEPEFLIEPDRQQFSTKLWEQDWDIFFFSGQSSSVNESGIIHLNPEDKLPIEELRNSLKKVSDRGLQLAIFNSCDGLKLAEYLAELNIPQIIVMRELVPDTIAQLFLEYFLQAYSGGESLYLAVRQARSRLEAIEKDVPGSTWLPIIYQTSLEVPPTWEEIVHGTPPLPFQQITNITEKNNLADEFKDYFKYGDTWNSGLSWYADEPIENLEIIVTFSPKLDNPYFISNGSQALKIWEIDTWKNKQKIVVPGVVDLWFSAVAISPDSRMIAACKQYKVMVWRLGEEKPTYTFSKTPFANFFDVFGFDTLEFSPDGQMLAANDNQEIKLWNLETGQEIAILTGHSDKVTCLAFSPKDPRILASCSYDKTIKIWRVDTGKSICTLSGHIDEVYAIAFSPDGQILASGGKDNIIQLWSIYDGELPTTLRSQSDAITCLAFNPDGRTFVSGSNDETIIEWTVTGKQLHTFPEQHKRGVTSVSFSPDGKMLISGGRDQTIKVWRRSNLDSYS